MVLLEIKVKRLKCIFYETVSGPDSGPEVWNCCSSIKEVKALRRKVKHLEKHLEILFHQVGIKQLLRPVALAYPLWFADLIIQSVLFNLVTHSLGLV